MDHLVGLEGEGVHHAFADHVDSGGDVGLFFHVDLHVLLKAGLHGEALPAVDTYVRVEIFVDLKVLVKVGDAAEDFTALVALQAVGLVDDDAVLRFHRQLPAVVRLHLHHVVMVTLQQHFPKQSFVGRSDVPRETMHFTVLHFYVVVVRLCYYGLHTGHRSELCA